jgi:uncharacterized membrane protein
MPRERSRVESLSDGVFAIALTLLTLNVRLDQGPHESFNHALRQTAPELATYALSFAVIAVFWVGHHRLFSVLERVDHSLVVLNFVYLAIIAVIPFPSQVLGGNSDEAGAVVLYATVLALGGIATAAEWWYARHASLLDTATSRALVTHSIARALSITIVFGVSILVAIFASPRVALLTWLAVIPLRLALRRRFGSLHDVAW